MNRVKSLRNILWRVGSKKVLLDDVDEDAASVESSLTRW